MSRLLFILFSSVCFPLKARTLCTVGRAKHLCMIIFFVMSVFAIPSALRYEKLPLEPGSTSGAICYTIVPSAVGSNESFMLVYAWLMNTLRSFLPLLIIVLLNFFIIRALKKQRMRGVAYEKRHRITLMLMVVVVVFIVCITPGEIP